MVPLDRALVSSYRLSIVNMSLTAAVWPQFATQVFRGGIGRLTCIRRYVNKQVTTFAFRSQATTCSKHHTRTVMDAGCECAPGVRSADPSDSWDLVFEWFQHVFSVWVCGFHYWVWCQVVVVRWNILLCMRQSSVSHGSCISVRLAQTANLKAKRCRRTRICANVLRACSNWCANF